MFVEFISKNSCQSASRPWKFLSLTIVSVILSVMFSVWFTHTLSLVVMGPDMFPVMLTVASVLFSSACV